MLLRASVLAALGAEGLVVEGTPDTGRRAVPLRVGVVFLRPSRKERGEVTAGLEGRASSDIIVVYFVSCGWS